MRGEDQNQEDMFSYISPEKRIPRDHPLRTVRQMVDAILAELSPHFSKIYSDVGRPSIPPEKLLRALLLQILYTIRSERQLMEQLDYNLLFRWFVGLNMDASPLPGLNGRRWLAAAIEEKVAHVLEIHEQQDRRIARRKTLR